MAAQTERGGSEGKPDLGVGRGGVAVDGSFCFVHMKF